MWATHLGSLRRLDRGLHILVVRKALGGCAPAISRRTCGCRSRHDGGSDRSFGLILWMAVWSAMVSDKRWDGRDVCIKEVLVLERDYGGCGKARRIEPGNMTQIKARQESWSKESALGQDPAQNTDQKSNLAGFVDMVTGSQIPNTEGLGTESRSRAPRTAAGTISSSLGKVFTIEEWKE